MVTGLLTVLVVILAIYFFGGKLLDLAWKKAVDTTLTAAELREKFEEEMKQHENEVKLINETVAVKEKTLTAELEETKEVKEAVITTQQPKPKTSTNVQPNRRKPRNAQKSA